VFDPGRFFRLVYSELLTLPASISVARVKTSTLFLIVIRDKLEMIYDSLDLTKLFLIKIMMAK
jgi:hypothetical protein